MIDFFTYLDIKAKAKGFQNGDEIDILSEDEPKLNSDNIVQVNYGGTGRMYETKLYGSTFLYKPAEKKYTYEQEKFRGIVQECASKVQSLFNSRGAVPCYYIENDTMCGSIQEKITESNQSINYYLAQDDENYIFKEKEIEQFMNEFIVDYLLCNFDSHGNNFITDSYGNIRGIDKEQALKHLDSNYNFLDINCNPNSEYGEKETIYNTIFKRYIKGDIDINFNKLIQNIEKVEQYSDEAYQRIFHRYCTEISKEFNKDYHNLMALILQRKKDIRKNMLTFIQDLKNQRLANTNNNNNNFSNVTSLSMVSPEISPEKAKHR